jgi:hypothetical protein
VAKPYEGPRDQTWYRLELPRTPDQFGRLWTLTVEKATLEPCGVVTPCNWDDPLRTPQTYIGMRKVRGQVQTDSVKVDFDRWVTDQTAAEADWRRLLHTHGREQYKTAFAAMVKSGEAEHDELLRDLTGPKPFPPVAALKQAAAGDKRYLGLEPLDAEARLALGIPEPDDLLLDVPTDPFAGATTWPEFLAAGRRAKLAPSDIGAAWKSRKAQAVA